MARLRTRRAINANLKDRIIQILLWSIPIIFCIWLIWAQNNLVLNDNMVFKVAELPKSFVGYKIVHISDFCNYKLDVVDNVEELNPDVIILSGGYSDSKGNSKYTVKQVEKLCKIAKVYYVCNKDEEDVLKDTDAINITSTNIILKPFEEDDITLDKFIEKVYGEKTLEKLKKDDEESKEYMEYIAKAFEESKNASINLIGIDNYSEENGKYEALEYVNSLLESNTSDYTIGVTGNLRNVEEIANSNLDIIFSSGTFGTNLISDDYTKGTYGINGTQLFLTAGIGQHEEINRIFNFPQIQCITLSDGTIENKNPLEKFIGKFAGDTGTIFDNDGGFKEYKYEYKNQDNTDY